MIVTAKKNDAVAKMSFASVYPHYLDRIEKHGRTKAELHEVINWLTGYNEDQLQQLLTDKVTFETFYAQANMHPNAHLITGVICGYRIETIPDKFTLYRHCRYLDKLVDELAKGRKMEKILRTPKT